MKNFASGSFVNKMGKLPAAPKKWQTFCLTGNHSSRMRTTCLLTVSRSIPCIFNGGGGGGRGERVCPTTPADRDSPGHVTCDACWEANPSRPHLLTEWQTLVKILPCPTLRFLGSKKTIVSAVRYFICDSLNFSRCLPPANRGFLHLSQ